MRDSYERAEQDEQYTALAAALPKAAAAVTAVGAAEKAAAQDRDPVSALGATLLGRRTTGRQARRRCSTRAATPRRPRRPTT